MNALDEAASKVAYKDQHQAQALPRMERGMDEFLEDFLETNGFGPPIDRRDVPETSLEKFRGKLPNKLLQYWKEFGWSGYGNGLLWLVNPDDWEDELDEWLGHTPFLERDSFYVIARTAFGELILWGEKTGASLKVVTIHGMVFPRFNEEKFKARGADRALQLMFAALDKDAFDVEDEDGNPLFEKALKKLGPVDQSTMYAFVPALSLGGKADLNRIKKVDAHTHLGILAQTMEVQVMRDIAADV